MDINGTGSWSEREHWARRMAQEEGERLGNAATFSSAAASTRTRYDGREQHIPTNVHYRFRTAFAACRLHSHETRTNAPHV